MSIICYIEFENSKNNVFYAGQSLRGTVLLKLERREQFRGIYIQFRGKSKSKWTEKIGTRSYSDEKLYSTDKMYVDGFKNDVIRMASGLHSFRFQCGLPAHWPSSVEGKIGCVKYNAYVVVETPKKWLNKEFKHSITVCKPLDLNIHPSLRASIYERGHLLGPGDIAVVIPLRGYAPGQTINVDIKENIWNQQMSFKYVVQLVQEVIFSGKRVSILNGPIEKLKSCSVVIQKANSCHANSNGIACASIYVPQMPPTDTTWDYIAKIEYYIRVSVLAPRCHKKSAINIPIMIGTQPIQSDLPSYEEALQMSAEGIN